MEKELIATNVIKKSDMEGTYQAAWRVTIGDKTGLVIHYFDYDKRDIENEIVATEPSITKAMLDEVGGEWWDPASEGFCDNGQRVHNPEALEQALEVATDTIYETP